MRRSLQTLVIVLIALVTGSLSVMLFAASAVSSTGGQALAVSLLLGTLGLGLSLLVARGRLPTAFLAALLLAIAASLLALWFYIGA